MARLDGKQKSPLPLIIGVAVLVLVGAGGYFLLANRGADGIAVQDGSVKIVDTKPGGLLEKSPSEASTDTAANSVSETSNAATSSIPAPAGAAEENTNPTAVTQDPNAATNSASQTETASSQEQTASENTAMANATAPATTETPAAQDSQASSTPAPATP